MFFFRRKKRNEEVFVRSKGKVFLHVDVHSHLIPGIDDGARDIDESLTLIRALKACGYKMLVTTPHIMSDHYRNDADSIANGLLALREAVADAGLDIRIEAAAEYYTDDGFFNEMKKERILSIADKYVLFETSYLAKPMMLEEMIFAIGVAGYTPLMAHPERYRYVDDPETIYTRWKELGVLFQVNINSFGGYYGKQAKALARFLDERGMIDFLGSDVHRLRQTEMLSKLLNDGSMQSVVARNPIKNDRLFEF
jgi:tyrosine-protein phosphatase YwqE